MAKNDGSLHNIPLEGQVNLNKFEGVISDWKDYLHMNSPMYGGVLSNFYKKDIDMGDKKFITLSDNNDIWSLKNNGGNSDIYLNDTKVKNLTNKTLKDTNLTEESGIIAGEDGFYIYDTNERYNTYDIVRYSKVIKSGVRYNFVMFYDYNSYDSIKVDFYRENTLIDTIDFHKYTTKFRNYFLNTTVGKYTDEEEAIHNLFAISVAPVCENLKIEEVFKNNYSFTKYYYEYYDEEDSHYYIQYLDISSLSKITLLPDTEKDETKSYNYSFRNCNFTDAITTIFSPRDFIINNKGELFNYRDINTRTIIGGIDYDLESGRLLSVIEKLEVYYDSESGGNKIKEESDTSRNVYYYIISNKKGKLFDLFNYGYGSQSYYNILQMGNTKRCISGNSWCTGISFLTIKNSDVRITIDNDRMLIYGEEEVYPALSMIETSESVIYTESRHDEDGTTRKRSILFENGDDNNVKVSHNKDTTEMYNIKKNDKTYSSWKVDIDLINRRRKETYYFKYTPSTTVGEVTTPEKYESEIIYEYVVGDSILATENLKGDLSMAMGYINTKHLSPENPEQTEDSILTFYNENILTGIGYHATLFTRDCQEIVKRYDDVIYYIDDNANLHKIEISNEELSFSIFNGYIIFNTTNYVNTVKINKPNEWSNIALSYNNCLHIDGGMTNKKAETNHASEQIFTFIYAENFFTNGNAPLFPVAEDVEIIDKLQIASAINEYYTKEVINNYWLSTIYNPVYIKNVIKSNLENVSIDSKKTLSDVDKSFIGEVNIYKTDDNGTGITYFKSIPRYNKDLEGSVYPLSDGNVVYNTPLLSKFIENYNYFNFVRTTNNNYMLLQDADTFKSIFAYNLLTQSSLNGMFVIQGASYGYTDEYIIPVSYNSGVINQGDPIINIKGMKYISSTPYIAYFYSASNKSIYAFKGDNILRKVFESNRINKIYKAFYNTSTQVIYALTNDGILCLNENGSMFKLEYAYFVDMRNNNDYIYFVDENRKNVALLSYNQKEDYDKVPIEFETELYGTDDFTVNETDCVYVRIVTDGDYNDFIGDVEITSHVLTQTSKKTDTKVFHIEKKDWDMETSTILLRYQPKYQQGVGFSVKVKSDFPISAMYINSSPISITNSKNNI